MSELRGYEQRASSPRSEFTEQFRWSVWLKYSYVKEPILYIYAWDEKEALDLMSRFVDAILKDGAKYNQDITTKKDGRWSWILFNNTNDNEVRVWVQEDIAEENEEENETERKYDFSEDFKFLNKISWDIGTMGQESFTEKTGERIREIVEKLKDVIDVEEE